MDKVQAFQFIKWYIKNDYLPDAPEKRRSIFFNKIFYFILIVSAFILSGLLNAFTENINKQLYNPYFNSIPASCVGVPNFDESVLRSNFSNFNFDPTFLEVAFFKQGHTGNQERLNGISLFNTHPYFNSINRAGNIIWESSHRFENDKSGLTFSEAGINKLGVILAHLNDLDTIDFELFKIDGLEVNQYTSVQTIVKSLPDGKDFIIPVDLKESYLKSNLASIKSKEASDNWDWKIEYSKEIDVEKVDEIIDQVEYFFDSIDLEASCIPSMKDYSTLNVNFEDKEYYEKGMQDLIIQINEYFQDLDQLRGIQIAVLKNQEGFEEKIALDDYYSKWIYFTITPLNFERDEIYSYTDSIAKIYPDLYIDTKSLDTVFFLEKINRLIKVFEIVIFLFIIISSVILNYKILNFHLYQNKKHIAYLKNIGVEKRAFHKIYIFEAVAETSIVVLLGILLSYSIQWFMNFSLFIFKIDFKIIFFILIMLILMILVYYFSINKLLKQDFRKILG